MIIAVIATIAYWVLLVFFLLMWGRFLIELAMALARWRPQGPMVVVAEAIMTVTDPPLRLVRRVVPPIRVGGMAIDLAWSLLMLVVLILLYVALAFL